MEGRREAVKAKTLAENKVHDKALDLKRPPTSKSSPLRKRRMLSLFLLVQISGPSAHIVYFFLT